MQGLQQLSSSFPAAEGVGQPSIEKEGFSIPSHQETAVGGVTGTQSRNEREGGASQKPSYKPSKVEKRTRRPTPSLPGPYLHPLPTIETLMTYPSISQPVYHSLLRGEPPARSYRTVIHTPKPRDMRVLDENLLRSAEITTTRRRARANSGPRSRSSTGSSSTGSSATMYSAASSNTTVGVSESSISDVDFTEPSSPAGSVSSTSKATIASSPSHSRSPSPSASPRPQYAFFPSFVAQDATQPAKPVLAPVALSPLSSSVESDLLSRYADAAEEPRDLAQSVETDNDSRPVAQTQTDTQTLEWVWGVQTHGDDDDDDEPTNDMLPSSNSEIANDHHVASNSNSHTSNTNTPSTRSSAPSPSSSAYPSPPSSPDVDASRRSSSSSGQEYLMYPSPPASPSVQQQQQQQQQSGRRTRNRERRAFSFPSPPPDMAPTPPKLRRRSASLNDSHAHVDYEYGYGGFDLGEAELGGGALGEDDAGVYDEWSMYGGRIANGEVRTEREEGVVYGSAGLAVSPRAMMGRCGCGLEREGLGLYVIEEERGEDGEGV